MTTNKKPTHTAYVVEERGQGRDSFWRPVGAAWTNKDGSFTLNLDVLPVKFEGRARHPRAQISSRCSIVVGQGS